ncbi:hypothetical protein [Actinoplanes aureus]|uniref:Secreted protein n=1 Tax=Actinoplanes aureus TaxID=2792083 RepID=A0A931CGL6_9ACTN|nr:hypothetical protein [Actinoplanes aureus]MBG0565758.1 hypothetical protein [Actinoplanes aureus]
MYRRSKPLVAFVGSVLVSMMFTAPSSAAAKPLPTAPPATGRATEGDITWDWSYTTNNNASARCRKKQSYVKADYSGDYLVYLKMSHSWVSNYEYFEDWGTYWDDAQTVWTASLLSPDYSHREGYINVKGPYVNQTRGPGMIGFSVYDRDTKEQLAVYFGDMNILCGKDYQITISDE